MSTVIIKDDIVGFGGSSIFVSLSNGSGSFVAPTPYNIALTKNNGSWSDNNNYPRIVGDVNGDNKGDLIGFGATNVFTSLSGINTVNPPTKPTVSLSVTDSSAAETTSGQTANPGQFTVTRTGTTTAPLVVYYTTTGGTATKGTDYQNLTGSVTIPTGSTTANITIDVIDDSLVEPSETVIVNLSANTNYNAGNGGNYVDYGDTSGTVTIADNDVNILSTSWKAEYFNNVNLSDTPVFTENLGSGSQNFSKNWGGNSPASSVPVDNFSARFTTERYLAPGLYHIKTNSDDGARVWINNQPVIDRWIPGAGLNSGYFYSTGGNYPVKVEYSENYGGAAINFDIINYTPFNNFGDPNGIANSWGASFYHWNGQGTTPSFSAGDLIGTVNLGSSTRSDGRWGMNAQNWGNGAVLGDRNLPHDNFVMDAYTRINFEAGHTYKVGLSSDDGYRMWAHKLNGNPFNITNNAVGGTWMMDAYGGKEFTFTAPESGTFDFHVQMFEGAGNAYFDLTVQDVTTPPPPSGLMATSTNLTKLINGQLNGQYIDVDGWYGAQCWDLVAYAAGINSSSTYWLTTHWKPGANVMGNGNVAVGTAIATFLGPNGAYDNPYGGQHTAIFAGYGTQNGVSGFYVWDQNWSPGYIQKHFIGNNQSSTSDADNYYVIQV